MLWQDSEPDSRTSKKIKSKNQVFGFRVQWMSNVGPVFSDLNSGNSQGRVNIIILSIKWGVWGSFQLEQSHNCIDGGWLSSTMGNWGWQAVVLAASWWDWAESGVGATYSTSGALASSPLRGRHPLTFMIPVNAAWFPSTTVATAN